MKERLAVGGPVLASEMSLSSIFVFHSHKKNLSGGKQKLKLTGASGFQNVFPDLIGTQPR